MIFRYPEMAHRFHSAPVPLQVVTREVENFLLERGIEPIVYKIIPGCTGPIQEDICRRIEIQCGPFLYSAKLIDALLLHLEMKYTKNLLAVHRRKYDKIPERLIFEIPNEWAEQPKVFLAKFGYIKGGNHA